MAAYSASTDNDTSPTFDNELLFVIKNTNLWESSSYNAFPILWKLYIYIFTFIMLFVVYGLSQCEIGSDFSVMPNESYFFY